MTDDGTYLYYYDCENRLTDVNDQSDDPVASYAYDFAGRRVKKIVYGLPDVITKYCYDGDQVIAEYEGDTLVRKFIYGPGIDEPIMMINVSTGDKYYYHFDGLDSVVALTDENANIVEKYSYDVFGEPTIRNSNNQILTTSDYNSPYMFTGRRLDGETGLYYYRTRYYSPYIGRFLQTDPIGYYNSMNLYEYCWNNPLNWIDPWGLDILGIHSSAGETFGHSWISYTTDTGLTTTYGLYRYSHASEISKLRPDTDVRVNIERGLQPRASRYYNNLTDEQKNKFNKWLEREHKYRFPTNNCSSWASDIVREVTGEDVDADDERLLGVETPGELQRSIEELEKNDPTKNEAVGKSEKQC